MTVLPGNARDGQTTTARLDYQEARFGTRPSELIGDGQYGTADRWAELAECENAILSPVYAEQPIMRSRG